MSLVDARQDSSRIGAQIIKTKMAEAPSTLFASAATLGRCSNRLSTLEDSRPPPEGFQTWVPETERGTEWKEDAEMRGSTRRDT